MAAGLLLRKRKEYFEELDNLLVRFSSNLVYAMETVPTVLGNYKSKSALLGRQIAAVVGNIRGEDNKLPSGFLSRAEYRRSGQTAARRFQNRRADALRRAWQIERQTRLSIRAAARPTLFIMEIDIIFKIAAVGLLTAIVNQILKKSDKDEMATIVTLVGLVIGLLLVIDMLTDLFSALQSVFGLYT